MAKIEKNGPIPVYVQLSNILREQVKNGGFEPGHRLPSENELSQKHSISRMTARAALLQLEREGLVSAIGGKGRFARSDKSERIPSEHPASFTVGVLSLPEVSPPFHHYFVELLNGINRGFLHYHVKSRLFSNEEVANALSSLIPFLSQAGADGIIWLSPHQEDVPEIEELKEKGIPVVAVNRTFPGSGIDCVSCDHYKGAYQLVEYLIHLGHKNIVCISGRRDLDFPTHFTNQRWKGYVDAHTHNGLSVNPELLVEMRDTNKGIFQRLDALRKKKSLPTAIFLSQGTSIPPTLKYLNEKRIRIPQDISVVVFDELPLPAGSSKLTCIRQPLEKIGEAAVDILMKTLRGGKAQPAEIIIEPTFVPGDSCIPYSKMQGKK